MNTSKTIRRLKKVIKMADIEQKIINTQLNGKIEIVDAKFNQFMDEMRDRDNRRAAENSEIRQALQTMHYQNIFVIIGVIAIAVAVFLK